MVAVLFYVIAAFHAALVLGARWGALTQGGGASGSLSTSGRIAAAVSCVISVVMANAILARIGRGPLGVRPSRLATVLAWFTMVYAVIAVILNLIARQQCRTGALGTRLTCALRAHHLRDGRNSPQRRDP